jgi:hypothetical protein
MVLSKGYFWLQSVCYDVILFILVVLIRFPNVRFKNSVGFLSLGASTAPALLTKSPDKKPV